VVGAALGWLLGSAFRAAAGSNSRPGAAALKEQGEERIIWAEAGLGPPESLDQPTPAEQESERSATGRAR
jgi:hypothetical protein